MNNHNPEGAGGLTGTIWDNIISTAADIPNTKIPTTFQIKLIKSIEYVNPETGMNMLWTNTNATKHMGEYIARFGGETASTSVRSQLMLESYSESLNKAMKSLVKKSPGTYFGVYGNWELGINTETGVVYHALML